MENQKKDLCQLFGLKNYLQEQIIARNRYARTDVEGYAFAAKPVPEYVELMEESSRQMDDLLLQIMDEQDKSLQSGPEKFLKQDVFVWGGPTQLWGGTMDPDCAVRGMEFFGAENAVYVYGSLNEENLDLHKNCKKLIFQIR